MFLSVLSTACSITETLESVESSVQTFHRRLDEARYQEIYSDAHADYRSAAPEPRSTELLQAIHTKLGIVKAASRSTWNVNYGTHGKIVTAVYDTVFENGKATETFVFQCSGENARLVGYNINSRDLIVK